ncbi:MAG: ABC transporter substrate-binding protein [Candidatus Hodarchaeota archaeon]
MEDRIAFAAIAVVAIVGIVVGAIGISIINVPTEPVDIHYGGQYYPGEFLLQGHTEFWDTYGLKIQHTLFSSGTENNEALLSGKIDINCGSDTKTIALFNAAEEGGSIEPLIIGTIQRGNRYSTVIPVDSEDTWLDLTKAKGKKVGYRTGTGADTIMRRYFATDPDNSNLSFDDFDWQSMNVEDMPAALEANQIDAFTAWEPTPAIAVDQGIGKLLRSYGDVALVPVSMHTTKSFAYDNPALIVAFLAAHLDKMEMIQNQKSKAAEYAAAAASKFGSEVTSSAFEDLYERIDYSIDFNTSIIDDILDTADFLANTIDPPLISTIPTLEYDRRFIEAALDLQDDFPTASGINDELSFSCKANVIDLAIEVAADHGLISPNHWLFEHFLKSILQRFRDLLLDMIIIIEI